MIQCFWRLVHLRSAKSPDHPIPADLNVLVKEALGFLIWVVMLILGLTSCSAGIEGGNTSGPGVSMTPGPATPHRDHITLVDCNESSDKYPRALFTQANAYMASSLEAAVVPNQDGLTAYITLINSRTYAPQNSLPALVLPPTSPDPTPPTLAPVPTPDPNDPYASGQKKQAVLDANAKAIQQYQEQLAQQQAQLAQLRTKVHQTTEVLRSWNPPVDPSGASVWGCVLLASQRFNEQPAIPGQRWLVMSTALDETEWIDRVQNLHLAGVHVRVLFYFCQTSAFCAYKEQTWRSVFQQAGVADMQFLDPATSSALPPLFDVGGGA